MERVESRPSTNETKLNKGDTIRYLLANAEWEGGIENQKRTTDPTLFTIRKIVVSKNEPILYYLDGEYAPSRGFVREELMHVDLEKIQYPPQRMLSASQGALRLENQHNRLVHTTRVSEDVEGVS